MQVQNAACEIKNRIHYSDWIKKNGGNTRKSRIAAVHKSGKRDPKAICQTVRPP